ncbi:hypothetical protein ACLOJK_020931 [Asimina triloba]
MCFRRDDQRAVARLIMPFVSPRTPAAPISTVQPVRSRVADIRPYDGCNKLSNMVKRIRLYFCNPIHPSMRWGPHPTLYVMTEKAGKSHTPSALAYYVAKVDSLSERLGFYYDEG